jgi:hypothetical protein
MICLKLPEPGMEPDICDPAVDWPACLRWGEYLPGGEWAPIEVSRKGKTLFFSGHDDAILFKQLIIYLPQKNPPGLLA